MVSVTRKRSLVKAVTYRAVMTVTLAILSWLFTGSVEKATNITIAFTIVAIIVYYTVERAWNKINWGRK